MNLKIKSWKELSKKEKIFGIIGLFIILSLFTNLFSKPKPLSTTPQTVTQTTPQKEIAYEIVKRWTIPNGGEGKLVVISPDLFNETDLTSIGEKLKKDTSKDRNASIIVYTDKRAAELYGRLASETNPLTKEEDEFYNTHMVASYHKNANTGINEFTMYLDGVMGTNHKTINY